MIKEVSKWKTASLSQLVIDPRDDVVDGPFGSRLKASEYVNSGIPIVRLQNIDRNRFIDKNLKFVTKEKASEISRHHFVAEISSFLNLAIRLAKRASLPHRSHTAFWWQMLLGYDRTEIRLILPSLHTP